MAYGWGTGLREFVGYGAGITCSHCGNNTTEQIFVTYSYEMAMLIKWRHMGDRGSEESDGYIQFVCPICTQGSQIVGFEAIAAAKKRIAKQHDAATAASFAIDAQHKITDAAARFNIQVTASWFRTLGYLDKRNVTKTLVRVGLPDVAAKIAS